MKSLPSEVSVKGKRRLAKFSNGRHVIISASGATKNDVTSGCDNTAATVDTINHETYSAAKQRQVQTSGPRSQRTANTSIEST